MSDRLADTIKQSPLFKHLPDEEIDALVEASTSEQYEAGEVLIEEGGKAKFLYVVTDGDVRVWTTSLDREVELKTLSRGAYFGEVSLMSGKTATATVEALDGPVTVVEIPREAILELVERDEKVRKMLEGVTLARAKDTIGKVLQ